MGFTVTLRLNGTQTYNTWHGAMTLSIMTFSKTSLSAQLSINGTEHNNTVIVLSVILPNVVLLNVVAPLASSVVILSH